MLPLDARQGFPASASPPHRRDDGPTADLQRLKPALVNFVFDSREADAHRCREFDCLDIPACTGISRVPSVSLAPSSTIFVISSTSPAAGSESGFLVKTTSPYRFRAVSSGEAIVSTWGQPNASRERVPLGVITTARDYYVLPITTALA